MGKTVPRRALVSTPFGGFVLFEVFITNCATGRHSPYPRYKCAVLGRLKLHVVELHSLTKICCSLLVVKLHSYFVLCQVFQLLFGSFL